jgi:glycosyltransferase 2 family protein
VTGLWSALANTFDRLGTAAPEWVLAALALYIASLFIVGARWRGFVRMLGADITALRATLATLGGIAVGNLTPSSRLAGEACRMTLGRVDTAVTWRQITIATTWDRLSEIPPIAVLCVMTALALGRTAAARSSIAILAMVVAIVIFALVGVRRWRKAASGERHPGGWLRLLPLERCDVRTFAAGVGWSSLLWLQDVLRIACAGLAFGVTLSPTRIATLAVLAMIGGLVPTVGGIGAVESGLMGGLVAFGVEVPTAAAITAVERAISLGFSTAAGALVVMLLGGRSLLTVLRDPSLVSIGPNPRRSSSHTSESGTAS